MKKRNDSVESQVRNGFGYLQFTDKEDELATQKYMTQSVFKH